MLQDAHLFENIKPYLSDPSNHEKKLVRDVAYVKDSNGVEFFLTATILTNKNEIFNYNTYEYDELGIPFLAAVGREIYKFEKNLH